MNLQKVKGFHMQICTKHLKSRCHILITHFSGLLLTYENTETDLMVYELYQFHSFYNCLPEIYITPPYTVPAWP